MAASSDSLPPVQDAHAEPVAPQADAAEDAGTLDPDAARDAAPGDGAPAVAEDRSLVTTNPDRAEKLLALRHAIVTGTYTVNAERIARRLSDDL